MTKGNPDLQHYSQKGYDAEITALDILEKLGYEIIYAPEKLKREFEERNKTLHNSELHKKYSKVSLRVKNPTNYPINGNSLKPRPYVGAFVYASLQVHTTVAAFHNCL